MTITLQDLENITPEQQAENRRMWVEDLRSGLKQTTQALSGFLEDGTIGYCCLGVACKTAIRAGATFIKHDVETAKFHTLNYIDDYEEDPDRSHTMWEDDEQGELPWPVRKWLGLRSGSGELVASVEYVNGNGAPLRAAHLIGLNDDARWGFEGIADLIEQGKVRLEA